ncbi:MAG: hypothetical protein ACE144_07680 [Thermodesulfobacteriota bacterium]
MRRFNLTWRPPSLPFRKIDSGKFSFLLESVEGGEKWGRYSFLGSLPAYLFKKQRGEVRIEAPGLTLSKKSDTKIKS